MHVYIMRVLTLTALTLLSIHASFAQSARYSFSGQISSLAYDGAGIILARDIRLGDPITVSFDLDFGRPGEIAYVDGTVSVLAPYRWDDLSIDYFYSRMVSGFMLPELNGGMYNEPEDFSECLAGWNRSDATGGRGVLKGGSRNSYFELDRDQTDSGGTVADWRVQDWQVGTMVSGIIVGCSELDYSLVRADLRLDSITIVPEPSFFTLTLLGGLAAVLCPSSFSIVLRKRTSCS